MGIRTNLVINAKQTANFWLHVDKTAPFGHCWEWLGGPYSDDYGLYGAGGGTWLAHRVSWYLSKGYLPDKFLLHSCDNRRCVNPDHLREGTSLDNARDRVSRDRSAKGQTHGRVKLNPDQVVAIRKSYQNKEASQRGLAAVYNVDRSTVRHILARRNWKHLK